MDSDIDLSKPDVRPKVVKYTWITPQGLIWAQRFAFTQPTNGSSPQMKPPLSIEDNTTGQAPELFCTIVLNKPESNSGMANSNSESLTR